MTLEEAEEFLSDHIRRELKDRAFGDSELSWVDEDGNVVAHGYLGRSCSVEIVDGYKTSDFFEAIKLSKLGKWGQLEYNS